MEDDLISGLTRQVKEEVIENYLTERRLLEIQVEDLEKQAASVRAHAVKTGRRLSRLAYLMAESKMRDQLKQVLGLSLSSFWSTCLEVEFSRQIRFIRVRAWTEKGRFRKLVMEAYQRLYQWMDEYRKAYETLEAECGAVNSNIRKFQGNFDLLAILSFLRTLDTQAVEQKHFLGENFTAQEVASVDKKLYVHQITMEKFDVPPPLPLPKPEHVEERLAEFAAVIYGRHPDFVRRLLE